MDRLTNNERRTRIYLRYTRVDLQIEHSRGVKRAGK